MELRSAITILQDTNEFREFVQNNPKYDIVMKLLDAKDVNLIQSEYPRLNLFPNPTESVISVTLVSRTILQNGYPKLKAYIESEKKKILHLFYSK